MQAIRRRTAAFTLGSSLVLGAALVAAPIEAASGAVPAAARAADPVYTICNAAVSVGANPFNDMNRLERSDPFYPVIKIWKGECKNVTVTPRTRIVFVNYGSWRVTSDLSAPGNSSSYSSCHTGPSNPGGDRKYKGYSGSNCTNSG